MLNIYDLHSQTYSLAKFQLQMLYVLELQPYEVQAIEKLNLYARYWENKSEALTKTIVTYKQKDTQSLNFHHCVCNEKGN